MQHITACTIFKIIKIIPLLTLPAPEKQQHLLVVQTQKKQQPMFPDNRPLAVMRAVWQRCKEHDVLIQLQNLLGWRLSHQETAVHIQYHTNSQHWFLLTMSMIFH